MRVFLPVFLLHFISINGLTENKKSVTRSEIPLIARATNSRLAQKSLQQEKAPTSPNEEYYYNRSEVVLHRQAGNKRKPQKERKSKDESGVKSNPPVVHSLASLLMDRLTNPPSTVRKPRVNENPSNNTGTLFLKQQLKYILESKDEEQLNTTIKQPTLNKFVYDNGDFKLPNETSTLEKSKMPLRMASRRIPNSKKRVHKRRKLRKNGRKIKGGRRRKVEKADLTARKLPEIIENDEKSTMKEKSSNKSRNNYKTRTGHNRNHIPHYRRNINRSPRKKIPKRKEFIVGTIKIVEVPAEKTIESENENNSTEPLVESSNETSKSIRIITPRRRISVSLPNKNDTKSAGRSGRKFRYPVFVSKTNSNKTKSSHNNNNVRNLFSDLIPLMKDEPKSLKLEKHEKSQASMKIKTRMTDGEKKSNPKNLTVTPDIDSDSAISSKNVSVQDIKVSDSNSTVQDMTEEENPEILVSEASNPIRYLLPSASEHVEVVLKPDNVYTASEPYIARGEGIKVGKGVTRRRGHKDSSHGQFSQDQKRGFIADGRDPGNHSGVGTRIVGHYKKAVKPIKDDGFKGFHEMAVIENEGTGRSFYDETENTDYVHVFDNIAKYQEKEDGEDYRGKEKKNLKKHSKEGAEGGYFLGHDRERQDSTKRDFGKEKRKYKKKELGERDSKKKRFKDFKERGGRKPYERRKRKKLVSISRVPSASSMRKIPNERKSKRMFPRRRNEERPNTNARNRIKSTENIESKKEIPPDTENKNTAEFIKTADENVDVPDDAILNVHLNFGERIRKRPSTSVNNVVRVPSRRNSQSKRSYEEIKPEESNIELQEENDRKETEKGINEKKERNQNVQENNNGERNRVGTNRKLSVNPESSNTNANQNINVLKPEKSVKDVRTECNGDCDYETQTVPTDAALFRSRYLDYRKKLRNQKPSLEAKDENREVGTRQKISTEENKKLEHLHKTKKYSNRVKDHRGKNKQESKKDGVRVYKKGKESIENKPQLNRQKKITEYKSYVHTPKPRILVKKPKQTNSNTKKNDTSYKVKESKKKKEKTYVDPFNDKLSYPITVDDLAKHFERLESEVMEFDKFGDFSVGRKHQ